MTALRALAPAKINLGLFVGPVRDRDGRHELVTVMQSISLADELTLEQAANGGDAPGRERAPAEPANVAGAADGHGAEAVVDEVRCPGVEGENLASRALAAFRAATGWDAPRQLLTIVKRIPVAAGLGGGSADAAAALRLARAASGLGSDEQLAAIATELGADVPAQLAPGRWLAAGAGERLRALPAPAEPLGVLVLPLAHALSTADVYAAADLAGAGRTREQLHEREAELADVLRHGAALPAALELLHNDLQRAAVSLCAEILPALRQAREAGAQPALVSGSGPTVVGLFAQRGSPLGDGPERAERAAAQLAGREAGAIAAAAVSAEYGQPRPA
jgi:4-diphosphocytidyl-2-C-methyl-D-erythritol kinase